jgi:hypothetical protein
MNEIRKLVGSKAKLVSLSSECQNMTVELVECFRNNTLFVFCSDMARIVVGQCFNIQFNQNNITFSYHTKVVRVCNEPYICLQVLLPGQDTLEKQNRETRVKVEKKELKITLQDGKQQIPVSVADIGINGAQLVSNVRLGNVEDIFNIELTIKEGASSIRLPCRIRYVRTEVNSASQDAKIRFHHGVEFLQLTANVENFLYRFVS